VHLLIGKKVTFNAVRTMMTLSLLLHGCLFTHDTHMIGERTCGKGQLQLQYCLQKW